VHSKHFNLATELGGRYLPVPAVSIAALALSLITWCSFAASATTTDTTKKQTTKKQATPKKAAAKPKASASTVKQAPKKKSATSPSASRKPVRKTPVATVRSRSQAAPTPERYKQIQEALAAKGYLAADQANGQWNDASVDALKRFQTAQNIDSTGKINSLSLIALGLGPKHDASSSPAVTSPAIAPQATPAPAAP
jgi:hypothetical protein